MAQKILGIDLGTYSLKVVRLERKMNDVAILDYFEEPLHPHSRLSHPEQVKLALEKLMSAHDLAADVVSASFPGQLLSARILEIPVTNPRKIHQMVDFELESYVPFALEELFSDHHILSFAEGAARVLSVYTNEKNIGTYIEALAQVNLEPKYFGADFTDLAALCSVSMVPPEGYFVLCDMGHSKTNLVILKDRQVIYTRTLGVAGLHFTKAIQRIFNINFEKAEAIKLSRGKLILRDDESDQVSRLMNRVAQDLISGIRQTFLGVKHVYPDFNVQAIYCTGGTSRLIGILDFLSFHLKTNVFELEPLEFIEHNLSDVEDVECLIGQSLAAALRPILFNKSAKN